MTTRHWEFAQWLEWQLAQRGWKQADLVRASGLSSGLLSNVMSGERKAGAATCKVIARALELPEAEVLIQAGLMSRPREWDSRVGALVELFQQLGEDDQDDILALARTKYHRNRAANAPKLRKAS